MEKSPDRLCGWTESGTWYHREGRPDQPLLLLIHGATVPSWEFDRLVPHFHKSGWQTLRFDLLGHGQSARPEGPYTLDALVEQAEELLRVLEVRGPVGILGHSLGAVIATALAQRLPGQVGALILVAPMLDFMGEQPWSRLLQAEPWGLWLMRGLVIPLLKRRRKRRYEAIGAPELAARFEEQLARPGFDRALLSLFQNQTLGNQEAVYRSGATLPVAKLVVWGEEDRVVSAEQVAVIREQLGPHTFCSGAGLEHNLLLTHSAWVSSVMLAFLQESPLLRRHDGTTPVPDSAGCPGAVLH